MESIKRVKLSDISELITKGTTPTTLGYEFQDEGVNFLKIECFDENGAFIENKIAHISDECNNKLKRSQLQAGDILFSIAGAIGRVAVVTEQMLPANTNQALAIIRIKRDDVYLPYIRLILTSPIVKEQFERKKQGVAQLNISLKDINELTIPLPDKLQQMEYASLFDRISNVINARKNEIQKLDDLIKARFVEMFGDPESDKTYPQIAIKDLTDVVSGGTPDRKNRSYWEDGTIPWIKTTELQNNRIKKTEEYITDIGLDESSAKIVPQHTVLIAMYGQGKTRGMTAFLDIPASTNQACACLLPSDKIQSEYLWQYMIISYDRLRNLAQGGNQPNLNGNMIKNFTVLVPPNESQIAFVEYVKQVDKSKAAVEAALNETKILFDSMMQEYFG